MQLGKFCPPGIERLSPRPRLFDTLDAAREGTLLWISAPAGAGKTSLLAGWLAAREIPTLWYQVDTSDNEPATFFHFLRLGVDEHIRDLLPQPSAESIMAPEAFARRFFTALFDAWKQPHIMVFDNGHALSETSPIYRLIDLALDLLPPDSLLVVASRHEAPAALARRFAYANTTRLGWDELRFTEQEAAEMAALWGVSLNEAAKLHRASDGWAAMQMLMMRSQKRAAEPVLHSKLLFDFLDREVFAELAPGQRSFLAELAILPEASAELAQRLTGFDAADALLVHLAQEQLLTTRHRLNGHGACMRYRFHPLLREFLLTRLQQDQSPDAVRRLMERAVHLLAAEGETETATEIAAESQSWSLLANLILEQAPSLMAAGRLLQLRAWLAMLPDTEFLAQPWLSYWKGVSLRPTEPAFCRQPLEHAYQRFMETDDARGAWLAWAAIFESYAMPWNDYGPVQIWLTELEQLQSRFPTFPSPEVEALVVGAGTTLFLGDPFHPLLKQWVECAGALLAGTPPLHAIGPLAYFYALYHASGGEAAGVRDAKALLDRVAFSEREYASYPYSYALFAAAQTFLCAASLRPDEADEWVTKGLKVTAEAKQPLLDFILQLHGVHAAGMVGDTRIAASHHHAMSGLFDPSLKLQTLLYRYNEACIRLMEGEVATARELAVRLIAPMEAAGAGFPVVITQLLAAQALALEGNGRDAQPYLIPVLDFGRRFPSPTLEFQAELTLAYIAFNVGNEHQARVHLKTAMALSRRTGCLMNLYLFRDLLAPLCAQALEASIESEHVQRLIHLYKLAPPPTAADSWPWAVRIYTLGRFSVTVDDNLVTFNGKTPKRPLQLLKAIIAFGGQDVPASRLIDALWSDSDSQDAQAALAMAVSRLRKLLRHAEAIAINDGKISIDETICWVDALVFRRLSRQFGEEPDNKAIIEKALELYNGVFLSEEDDAAWGLTARHTLASHFWHLASIRGKQMGDVGDWDDAVMLYRRVLECEPFNELTYQSLMEAYLQKGEAAQALEVYRQCREVLSRVMEIGPSSVTEALAARARQLSSIPHSDPAAESKS